MFTFHCQTACSCKWYAECYRLIYCVGILTPIINRKAQVRFVTPYLLILSYHYFIMKLICMYVCMYVCVYVCLWIQCSFFWNALWNTFMITVSYYWYHYDVVGCKPLLSPCITVNPLHGKALTCGGYPPFTQMLPL